MIIVYLTCANDAEAKNISQTLLGAKLIACARRAPVSSSYWWSGKINHDHEVLLMMETIEEKFDDINKMVGEIHSYEEHVMTAVSVFKTTAGVEQWLKETFAK